MSSFQSGMLCLLGGAFGASYWMASRKAAPNGTDNEHRGHRQRGNLPLGSGLGNALNHESSFGEAVHDRAQAPVVPPDPGEQSVLVLGQPATLLEVVSEAHPLRLWLHEPATRRCKTGMKRGKREPASRPENAVHGQECLFKVIEVGEDEIEATPSKASLPTGASVLVSSGRYRMPSLAGPVPRSPWRCAGACAGIHTHDRASQPG